MTDINTVRRSPCPTSAQSEIAMQGREIGTPHEQRDLKDAGAEVTGIDGAETVKAPRNSPAPQVATTPAATPDRGQSVSSNGCWHLRPGNLGQTPGTSDSGSAAPRHRKAGCP